MTECKATVRMKKPWTRTMPLVDPKTNQEGCITKPTVDEILEAFGNEILDKLIDDHFEVTIKKVNP